MGWADALSLLGIPYDSEEALEEARKVGAFLKEKIPPGFPGACPGTRSV